MENKLLPALENCPFCNGSAEIVSTPGFPSEWHVECEVCDARAEYSPLESTAIKRWNSRANSNDKLREALKEAFEKILEAIEAKEILTAKVFAKAGLNLIKNQH